MEGHQQEPNDLILGEVVKAWANRIAQLEKAQDLDHPTGEIPAERVAQWRQPAGLKLVLPPIKLAPPSKAFIERLARRRRLERELEIADYQLELWEMAESENAIDNSGDLVAAEAVRLWRKHVAEIKQALETGEFDGIEVVDGPVPGYSVEGWNRRGEELQAKQLQTLTDAKASLDRLLDAADAAHAAHAEAVRKEQAGADPEAEPEPEPGVRKGQEQEEQEPEPE